MESESAAAMHPALLPPGTQVGSWRVVGWVGRGVYGAVYRVESVHTEQAEPVVLKLALVPGDPRFAREVELLSRVSHPSVPRVHGHGKWRLPGGTLHPYVVMEWVDGMPLYEWAREHEPSSREVARVLAQLARALQALHAQAGLHRDVKGENIRVRRSDGRAMLLDFGTGVYAGAATLTPPQVQPGTPAYQSPEAHLAALHFRRGLAARYVAWPTDDVYALGVTACRLVTGEYPEVEEPVVDEQGAWRPRGVRVPAALHDEARVEPGLRACILRMLSERPEERGGVEELAEALERAAVQGEPGAAPARIRPRRQPWPWWRSLAAAAGVVLIGTGGWWAAAGLLPGQSSTTGRAEAVRADAEEAGRTGLGEAAAPTAANSVAPALQPPEVLGEEPLPTPQPGQTRPDAKGRCPRKRQVALNDGCWLVTDWDSEECAEASGYRYKGMCYVPPIPPGRRPTSNSTHKP
jgi:eukaryotic-like serine/threonine-protein kinase